MAEAVSKGASVLRFIPKLLKSAATLYESIHNTPDNLKRVHTRIVNLGMLLSQIHFIHLAHPHWARDSAIQLYWKEKSTKLREDFANSRTYRTVEIRCRGESPMVLVS